MNETSEKPLGISVHLSVNYETALSQTIEALKVEGFGVLTEINVQETLKKKLGVELAPYIILGTCNPPLAHRALMAAPEVGLLLPCNVTVRQLEGGSVEVAMVDPLMMMAAISNPALKPIAEEALARLDRVAQSLAGTTPAHERRFNREIERLRDPDRMARLEVDRVTRLVLENMQDAQAVLDVGTGSGLFAEQFVATGLHVTGLDVNPQMLIAAQEFVPAGVFKEGIAEKLPFSDASFDLVFMGLLLHETDDVLAALQEAFRVTRQRLAILEWPDEEQTFGPPRHHRLAHEKIAAAAKQAGFKKVEQIRMENLVLYRLDR
jgi:uncharacterized protein (DUF302 family)/ubiquinone/menaquinone biosynthesis C-methylase UbiE